MAFGSRAVAPTYTSENGGSGKDTFFPTASGKNGASMEYSFRMFGDEDETVYREWAGPVKAGGRDTFRSCIVRADNPFDAANREKLAEIDAQPVSDEQKKELKKAANLKWTKQVFSINVLNRDLNQVQVLKGSWEAHKVDENTGSLIPARDSGGGRSLYGKLLSLVRTGAKVADPKQRGKALTINDPTQFDITLVCAGQGQQGKSYEFHVGLVTPLEDDAYTLDRWDIEGWVSGKGVWPNEALEKLAAGGDYYELVKEYGIQLYPEVKAMGAVAVDASGADTEDDEDGIFKD